MNVVTKKPLEKFQGLKTKNNFEPDYAFRLALKSAMTSGVKISKKR
jgi:hypothetical protein